MRYLKQATTPPGRDKPSRKKLAQKPSYPRGYARDLTIRFVAPTIVASATTK